MSHKIPPLSVSITRTPIIFCFPRTIYSGSEFMIHFMCTRGCCFNFFIAKFQNSFPFDDLVWLDTLFGDAV